MRIQRSILILAGACLALLLAGVLVAVAVSRRAETSYPPNSPEGTVATYLRLLQNGQVDQAYGMIATDRDPSGFRQQYDGWSQRSHRVTLVRSIANGNQATVTVDIDTFTGGAFGAADTTNRVTFTLERRGAVWRITGPDYLY